MTTKSGMHTRCLARDLFAAGLAVALSGPLHAVAQAVAEEPPVVDVTTSAPPEKAKAPAAALVSLVLAAGTGALILSEGGGKEDAGADAEGGLAAPKLESPEDGAKLADASRTAVLAWKPAAGATAYLVDIDTCDAAADACGDFRLEMTPATSFTVQLPAPFAARWRVRAVGPDNVTGPYSGFRRFSFEPGE